MLSKSFGVLCKTKEIVVSRNETVHEQIRNGFRSPCKLIAVFETPEMA